MKTLILLFISLIPLLSIADERVGEYPPSQRYAPIVKEINKSMFFDIIQELKSIYINEDALDQIQFEPNWENSFTVAYSSHRDNKWIVYVNGGMARATYMSPDSFRMLLCHEIGHLIGGAPFASVNRWASTEGQADYFAATKCMKRVLENKNNELFLKNMIIPPSVHQACKSAYRLKKDQLICIRTNLAGQNLISAFAYMLGEEVPSFDKKDRLNVNTTINDDYPSIQCRLDTIVSGSLCDIDSVGISSSNSVHENGCSLLNGDMVGLRPSCWFYEGEFF